MPMMTESRLSAREGRAGEEAEDEAGPERERPIAAAAEDDDENADDGVEMMVEAAVPAGGSERRRIAGPSITDAESPAEGGSKVDENAADDDGSASSSSDVLLSQGNAKTDDGAHRSDDEDEGAIDSGENGDVATIRPREDADRSVVSSSAANDNTGGGSSANIDRSGNRKEAEEGASSAPSKDNVSSRSSSDDSSGDSSSSEDSDDESSIVEGTEIIRDGASTIVSTQQSQDNEAHDHLASLHVEHEDGAVDDEKMNVGHDVMETKRACEISQPIPGDAETSTKGESKKDNHSADDDSSSSSSSSSGVTVETEEDTEIENLHSHDKESGTSGQDGYETAREEGDDDEEVKNAGINVHEKNIEPMEDAATNANIGVGSRANVVGQNEPEKGSSSAASEDSSSSESSSDDSSGDGDSNISSEDSDDEGSIVEGTEIIRGGTGTIVSTQQSQDNDAHDHPASAHVEHEDGAVDDEMMNVDHDVKETKGNCEISQPSPGDAETSTKDASKKDNLSANDDSSSTLSSSSGVTVNVEEGRKIKKLHSDDEEADVSDTASGEGDIDENVTNKGINVHEKPLEHTKDAGGSIVSSSATNANISVASRAKIVGQKYAEKGASSTASRDSSSSESISDDSSSNSDSSEDSNDESSIVEGTENIRGGTVTKLSTQKSQNKKVLSRPTSQIMSGKATPHVSIANSDQIFTQESAIAPTNLFGRMDRKYGDNQHKRGGEIESATPPNEEGKSKDARSAQKWDSDSSSSSSSSSDSDDSSGSESDKEREIPSKTELLANGNVVYDNKKPQPYPMTQASYESDCSSGSSSSGSEDDNNDGGSSNEEEKESNPTATPITDDKGASSSSSSDTSSSSDSSSDSGSESSSSRSEDERREADPVQQKSPVSMSILPVVRSSRGRRRTPLVSMSRKIIINTSTGVPKTESFAR